LGSSNRLRGRRKKKPPRIDEGERKERRTMGRQKVGVGRHATPATVKEELINREPDSRGSKGKKDASTSCFMREAQVMLQQLLL